MSLCSVCDSSTDQPCQACRLQPEEYHGVKDAWLIHRREDADIAYDRGVTVQWAVAAMPGGIVAVWDRQHQRFLVTAKQVPADARRYAWLEVTTACPHRCRHCFLGSRLGHGHVPLADVENAISAAAALGVDEIVLTGGEPTMHPHFVTILEGARQTGVAVRVLTNGWTQREAVVTALAAPGVQVEIPLLGWTEEHDRMTRTPGSFQRVTDTLRIYQSRGIALTLTTTLTRAGMRALPALRQLAGELGVPLAPSSLVRQGTAVENWEEIAPTGS